MEPWPPKNCPRLAWPLLSSQLERLNWYHSVIDTYSLLLDEHVLAPVSKSDITKLESSLACTLPSELSIYHVEFGALSLAENLCSANGGHTPIQPLLNAYPGVFDITDNDADINLAEDLVVFGDYLGNGNMFCFHKKTGQIYYFDHDTGAMLTYFFSSTQEYLDALMMRCLTEIHADDEKGEAALVDRFGHELVKKWLY